MLKELVNYFTFGARNTKRMFTCIDMLDESEEKESIIDFVNKKLTGQAVIKLQNTAKKQLDPEKEKTCLSRLSV